MRVLVHGRSAERAQAVAEETGAAGVHLADFSSLAQVRALAEGSRTSTCWSTTPA